MKWFFGLIVATVVVIIAAIVIIPLVVDQTHDYGDDLGTRPLSSSHWSSTPTIIRTKSSPA